MTQAVAAFWEQSKNAFRAEAVETGPLATKAYKRLAPEAHGAEVTRVNLFQDWVEISNHGFEASVPEAETKAKRSEEAAGVKRLVEY